MRLPLTCVHALPIQLPTTMVVVWRRRYPPQSPFPPTMFYCFSYNLRSIWCPDPVVPPGVYRCVQAYPTLPAHPRREPVYNACISLTPVYLLSKLHPSAKASPVDRKVVPQYKGSATRTGNPTCDHVRTAQRPSPVPNAMSGPAAGRKHTKYNEYISSTIRLCPTSSAGEGGGGGTQQKTIGAGLLPEAPMPKLDNGTRDAKIRNL